MHSIVRARNSAREQQKRIYGKITDKATNEEIPYAAVRIRKTSNGSSSDNNGYFSFYTAQLRDTLIISNLGYKDVKIPLSAKTKFPLNVKMVAENYELDEITIKPKREKYRKRTTRLWHWCAM